MKSNLLRLLTVFTFLISVMTLTLPAAETNLPAPTATAPNIPRLTSADIRPSFYSAGEFSVDVFGSTKFHRFDTLFARDNAGGIGFNWFPFRAAGIGIEARSSDIRHSFVDDGALKLQARLPWDRFALNFAIGPGFDFEADKLNVFAEVGPEFRFTRSIGAFASIRGVRPTSKSGEGERVMITAGVRYAFGGK